MAAATVVSAVYNRISLHSPPTSASVRSTLSSLPLPVSSRGAVRCFFLCRLPVAPRLSSLQVRDSDGTSNSFQTGQLLSDLKEKWDNFNNKSAVLIYGGGGIIAVWLSYTTVSAINDLPLLPNLLELVGLGYTGWFVYRYLLFKNTREELAEDMDALKKKITGTGE